MQAVTVCACANNATNRSLPAKGKDGQDGRGVKISGGVVLCDGRGVTREKSQFQTVSKAQQKVMRILRQY